MASRSLVALGVACTVALVSHATALAQSATTPGEVTTPHPTLEHLSIEWAIDGDDDADGTVEVQFREAGTDAWRRGLTLMRVPAAATPEGYAWTNRHIGSLFGLTPDTSYEIELTLSDPDGGAETRSTMARTRPVPTPPSDAQLVDVTPQTLSSALAAAGPGDVLVLGAGTYPGFTVANDGELARPIVIRGSDRDSVIIDGGITLNDRSHVWLENLTANAMVRADDSTGIVVRGCAINDALGADYGIYAAGASDGYFADNVIIGKTVWELASLGYQGNNIGDGVTVGGPGNVVQNNRVTGFRDCISLIDGGAALDQHSIDIIGNDLYSCADDGVEADFARGNVRVVRNRLTNTFIALSSQPSLGGPSYFIRNVQYNAILASFKPLRGSYGNYWFHNTVVKPGDAMRVGTGVQWGRTVFRNNVFIGGPDGRSYQVGADNWNNGEGAIFSMSMVDEATCDFDYDGVGTTASTFTGRINNINFSSFAEMVAMTTEKHAVMVDLGIFAATIALPADPLAIQEPRDLRLADGAAAVDVGEVLPNINDGFSGDAPDLGAYELGSQLPPYGPRTGGPVCGDSAVEPPEQCDDGNLERGDGCDENCMLGDGDTTGGDTTGGDGGPSAGGDGVDGGGCCRTTSGAPPLLPLAVVLLSLARSRARRRFPARTPAG